MIEPQVAGRGAGTGFSSEIETNALPAGKDFATGVARELASHLRLKRAHAPGRSRAQRGGAGTGFSSEIETLLALL